jgi:hypothetical protein
MTDSFPLTAAALRKHASDFHVFEQQLTLELGGLSGIAFAFINKLPMIDQNLTRQISYVSERLQESPDVFDLRVHVSGPRARMFSLSQPQLFLAVEKL